MQTGSTTVDDDGPQRLALVASALAGRTVAVAAADPGEPPWTDGITIFVDAAEPRDRQLESVTVQASLLAGGGLDADIVRKLHRRPALAKRYLAIEGQRALAANDDLLPYRVRSLIDFDLATRADSPAASLALAGTVKVADPPASFGVIKARNLLAAHPSVAQAEGDGAHLPRRKSRKDLAELDDEEADGDATDPFSSPVGGGGAIGKLLQGMLSRVRQLSGSGPPGADTPTHRSHNGIRGAGMVTSTAVSNSEESGDDKVDGKGRKYHEWDVHRKR